MASDYIAEHKQPPFELVELTNKDPAFYPTLGPWLSRREIVEELGGPVWDDDDKHWIIASNENDGLLGMVAYRRGTVCSLYVTTGARGQLVGTTMVVRLILRHPDVKLKAIATDASHHLFEQCGFKETGTKGRYRLMERTK